MQINEDFEKKSRFVTKASGALSSTDELLIIYPAEGLLGHFFLNRYHKIFTQIKKLQFIFCYLNVNTSQFYYVLV